MKTCRSLRASTFAADVRFPSKQQQLVVGKRHANNICSINGVCISPDSRIWVATDVSEIASWPSNFAALTVLKGAAVWLQAGLHALQLLCLWSTNTHKHWPRLFGAVVRELLIGCLAQHTHGGAAGTP